MYGTVCIVRIVIKRVTGSLGRYENQHTVVKSIVRIVIKRVTGSLGRYENQHTVVKMTKTVATLEYEENKQTVVKTVAPKLRRITFITIIVVAGSVTALVWTLLVVR